MTDEQKLTQQVMNKLVEEFGTIDKFIKEHPSFAKSRSRMFDWLSGKRTISMKNYLKIIKILNI